MLSLDTHFNESQYSDLGLECYEESGQCLLPAADSTLIQTFRSDEEGMMKKVEVPPSLTKVVLKQIAKYYKLYLQKFLTQQTSSNPNTAWLEAST